MGIRGIYLLIFNFGIRRKWVDITPKRLLSWKYRGTQWIWVWVDTREVLDDLGREKSLALVGIGTPDCPARSLVTVPAPLASNSYSENSDFQYTLKPKHQSNNVSVSLSLILEAADSSRTCWLLRYFAWSFIRSSKQQQAKDNYSALTRRRERKQQERQDIPPVTRVFNPGPPKYEVNVLNI
jgi:hypothetical protein